MNIFKELILRIITSILLRLYLVINVAEIILDVIFTFNCIINSSSIYDTIYELAKGAYFLIELTIGIFVLNDGKRAVNHSVPESLERTFYYICYLMVYRILVVILSVADFTLYRNLIPVYKDSVVLISDTKTAIVLGHVLAFCFNMITAIVIKLCADIMRENQTESAKENQTVVTAVPGDDYVERKSDDFEV